MSTVKLKRSAVQGKIPTTSDLELGELAINTYDGKLYLKKDDGTASIVDVTSAAGISDIVQDLTPQLGGDLDTNGNDILFGDNDKAIFGAGSDLQIFSDGTKSYLIESGTGDFEVRATDFVVKNADNTKIMASFNDGGNVTLRYDNTPKLATTSTGVDVTGTITSDGLTVDTNTLHVDSTNNRVGIGTSSPSVKLEVDAGAATGTHLQVTTTGSGHNFDMVDQSATARIRNVNGRLRLATDQNNEAADSSIEFLVDGDEYMRIDSSGNVGIGTSSPTQKLDVQGTILVNNEIQFVDSNIRVYRSTNDLRLRTGGTDRVAITSSGNVGIGTTSPSKKLHVAEIPAGDGIRISGPSSDNNWAGGIQFYSHNATTVTSSIISSTNGFLFNHGGSERLRITSAGNVGIGTTSPALPLDVNGTVRSNVSFRLTNTGQFRDDTATTTTTSQTVIAQWSASAYGGGKVVVEAKDGVNRHISEILITHDGTTAIATEYGTIYTSGVLATYDVDISGGNVRLLATPSSTNSTAYKMMNTLLFS